ncbi:MAG: phosphoribosylamine--glycine ligase [Anaerolineales bacterium]|nr:phosphoribosylamine--glycine ligase [Anaerolineales bacterium]
MQVLLIGSGGREHALAWKILQSPRLTQLYVAPGNAGTAAHNVPIAAEDTAALVAFAKQKQIDLVVVGPEVPLANGVVDALQAVGVKAFGPTQAAAQIEASKAFSKAFMARHNIPTARYQTFTDFYQAVGHLLTADYAVVIKASGLAAGKGVIVPNCNDDAEAALRHIMLDREFGAAGDEVIIEERLAGEEVSLLAFCDGRTVKVLSAAQDHKRLLDGDAGPNTGGMGAYAPAPIASAALIEEATRTILQPAVDGLRAEGKPFVGVLYAGLMLTKDGPRTLEFNCRLGDPETQVLLPLLETDLLDVIEACVEGNLETTEIKWKSGAAACVVLASEGYPASYPKGRVISGLDAALIEAVIFHAGTALKDEQVVTAGGRVLAVTGWGANLKQALHNAYVAVNNVNFDGIHFRKDIGWRAVTSAKQENQNAQIF